MPREHDILRNIICGIFIQIVESQWVGKSEFVQEMVTVAVL